MTQNLDTNQESENIIYTLKCITRLSNPKSEDVV